jgi:hypothetical protein
MSQYTGKGWRRTNVRKGLTAARPAGLTTNDLGTLYLDTTLDADGMPIFWQGTKWILATGADA